MSERTTRAAEVLCVLVIATGFGLAWLPLGFIAGGALVLFGLQGYGANQEAE